MKLFRWLGSLLAWRGAESGQTERSEPSEEASEVRQGSVPRSVTIGLDFGTSSTKVVFRDWSVMEGTAYAVDFAVDLPGYTRFSRPSVIALDDHEILFGTDAVEAEYEDNGATVLRSAKIQLLEPEVEPTGIDVPWSLPGGVKARGTSTLEGLVTLFLADTLRRSVRAASKAYPDLEPSDLAFNLDVPVEGLDDDPVAERFQRMLDVAIRIAPRLPSAFARGKALELWAEEVERVLEDPPEEGERPGELVPEAEAIIQGVGETLGSRSSDLYHAIVDIGAGTTDVGWFKLVERKFEDRLPFFAARTRRVGCNDVDEQLAQLLVDELGSSYQALQRGLIGVKSEVLSKEESTLQLNERSVTVQSDDLAEAAAEVAPKIYEHYSETFGPAYEKEKNTERWERIRTVVVGGGSLIPELRRRFEDHPRHFGESVELVDISAEMNLEAVGASERAPDPTETPFLTAAFGLASPKPTMPEPIFPSEMDPLQPESGPTGVYDYEVDY